MEKEKQTKTGDVKMITPPTGRSMSTQFLGKSWLTSLNTPPTPLTLCCCPWHFMEYLWLVQVICQVVPPPSLLPTPQSVHCRTVGRGRKKRP